MKKILFMLLIAFLANLGFYYPTITIIPSITVQAKTFKGKVYRYNYKGEKLLEKGNINAANLYYSSLYRRYPNSLNVKVGMGSIYSAQYKLDAAEKMFKQVLSRNPKHPGAHNGLGLVYYRRTTSSNQNIRNQIPELYEKAISEFKSAIKYAPGYSEAYNNLGKIYEEQGLYNEAEEQYKNALDIDPKNGNAMVNLGGIYQLKGETEAAIDQFKKTIKLNSKDSTAHYMLGSSYIIQGKYDEAIKSLQTSLSLFPNSAPVHDKLGEVYGIQGNEAAAINEYRKAILIKPEYTQSYLKLANVFERRGDDELAIAELRSAVNANPNFLEGRNKIAEISTNIGKESQAIKEYKEVIAIEPDNETALKGISRAYYFQAKKQAISGIFASPSDYVEAELAIRRAISTQPNDLELHLALLRVSKLAGNDRLAENELSMISSKVPQSPAESIVKGEALMALGRYREAESEFGRALNYTNNTDDILLLGDIFSVNGDLKLAKSAYEKALTKDSNNIKASKALIRVKQLDEKSKIDYRAAKGFYNKGQRFAAIDNLRKAAAINSVDAITRWLLAEAYRKENFYDNAIEEYKAYLQLSKNIDEKTYSKTYKTIESLEKKSNKMKNKGEIVKDYDEYVKINRKKY